MVVARCWQQWITEGRVYRRGRVRDVPGTQMIARSCNQKSGYFGTNNVASIDSTPLTSFQTSSAIKRNHKETTDRSWLEELTSAKTLTTDPYIIGSVDWILPTSGNLECDKTGDVSSSVMNPDSVSVLMTTAHVSGGAPASGRSGISCRAAYSNFTKV
ncbi:hypothetical protein TNCV_1904571 [Trichonephila clavipes]|nr:hypothetical protein TNCV_1904571 [Trichonephila clavipes]